MKPSEFEHGAFGGAPPVGARGIRRDVDAFVEQAVTARLIGSRIYRLLARFTTAIPQGPVPTGIFFVTCRPSTSMTETSFDGPFAV